jgi:hypothetical protein
MFVRPRKTHVVGGTSREREYCRPLSCLHICHPCPCPRHTSELSELLVGARPENIWQVQKRRAKRIVGKAGQLDFSASIPAHQDDPRKPSTSHARLHYPSRPHHGRARFGDAVAFRSRIRPTKVHFAHSFSFHFVTSKHRRRVGLGLVRAVFTRSCGRKR